MSLLRKSHEKDYLQEIMTLIQYMQANSFCLHQDILSIIVNAWNLNLYLYLKFPLY